MSEKPEYSMQRNPGQKMGVAFQSRSVLAGWSTMFARKGAVMPRGGIEGVNEGGALR